MSHILHNTRPDTHIHHDEDEKPKAIQIGAGNIGRGFIAPILSGAGYTVVFADIDKAVIDRLNQENHYEVHVLDKDSKTFAVDDVMGVLSTTDDIVNAIADPNAHVLTTAVGLPILDKVAPTIAKGLIRRREIGGEVLNVIACENTIGATSQLKDKVFSHLSESVDKDWVTEHVGFADCSVDRIVPPFDPKEQNAEPLDVGVEPFYEWVVNKPELKEPLPLVKDWKLTDTLRAYNERKLFTLNTGHCIAAYLGYLKGKSTIEDAILDEEILATVQGALAESGAALCKKHGFTKDEHDKYVQKIIQRFRNPSVKDDVARVGRQPLRKLSKEDRLVGPVLMCRQFDITVQHLLVGIAAALLYDDSAVDPQAKELQEMIADKGLEASIVEITGFETGSHDIKGIVEVYERLKSSRVSRK